MFLVLLGKGLDQLDRRHRPLHDGIDAAFGVAHLGRDIDDLAVEPKNQPKQQRNDGQRQQGQCRVERQQNKQHPAEQHGGRQDRQYAVHDHRLNGKAVGGDPVEQIADPLPAMKGEGQPLQVRVEGAAQIVDHPLPDPDRRVIVQQGQRPGAEMHDDNAETGKQQQSGRRRRRQCGNRKRLAAEHIVNHHLQRPRLEELEPGDQEDLHKRRGDPPPIRPQIGQQFRQQDQTVRGAWIGNEAVAAGSTGISGICLATVSMIRCMSLPKPTS